MTTKERLIQELESAPEELLEEVLNFVLAAKENSQQSQNLETSADSGLMSTFGDPKNVLW